MRGMRASERNTNVQGGASTAFSSAQRPRHGVTQGLSCLLTLRPDSLHRGWSRHLRAEQLTPPHAASTTAAPPTQTTPLAPSTPSPELQAHALDALSQWLAARGEPTASTASSCATLVHHSLGWDHDGGAPCGSLVVAALTLPARGPQPPTTVWSLVVQLPPPPAAAPHSPAPLLLRWAVSKAPGGGWRAPPPGWHTQPPASSDAGGGAWDTTLGPCPGADGRLQGVLLQLPLQDSLRRDSSGLVCVLQCPPPSSSPSSSWAKAWLSPHHLTDLFLPAHLPTSPPAPSPPPPHSLAASSTRPAAAPPHRSPGTESLRHSPPSQATHSASSHAGGVIRAGAGGKQAAEQQQQQQRLGRGPLARDSATVKVEAFIRSWQHSVTLQPSLMVQGNSRAQGGVCGWMVDRVAAAEQEACRSLMHRYNQGHALVEVVGQCRGEEQGAALAVVTVWLRMSAQRLLVWNRNYNVKPREISAAQDRLCSRLCSLAGSSAGGPVELRGLARLALTSVGRGGQGDVGQRIRDEILEVQSRNHCKGGMMEEWHQKLHNNTSPDDVVICQALLAYCSSGLDLDAYWSTLAASRITPKRLASFDRPIVSAPSFSPGQVSGLIRDLTAYLATLQAVHCGTDLASAAANVVGYSARDMKGSKRISVPPVPGVVSPELDSLLGAALHLQAALSEATMGSGSAWAGSGSAANSSSRRGAGHQTQAGREPAATVPLLPGVVRLLELLVGARHAIRPALLAGDAGCGGRHADVLFLDLALDSAARSSLEGVMGELRAAALGQPPPPPPGAVKRATDADAGKEGQGQAEQAEEEEGLLQALASQAAAPRPRGGAASQPLDQLLAVTCLVLEGACLSSFPNEDLVAGLKWLNALRSIQDASAQQDRVLQALSMVERLKRSLADQASSLTAQLQPAAEALGGRLGVEAAALAQFSEEVVRGGSAAPLAQTLGLLEMLLRRMTGRADWQLVSRGGADSPQGVTGHCVCVERLEAVQYLTYAQPTVLVVEQLAGHEDVPVGCVAVLSVSGACPDMLSHSAVRARNQGALLAACHDPQVAAGVRSLGGRSVKVSLRGQQLVVAAAD